MARCCKNEEEASEREHWALIPFFSRRFLPNESQPTNAAAAIAPIRKHCTEIRKRQMELLRKGDGLTGREAWSARGGGGGGGGASGGGGRGGGGGGGCESYVSLLVVTDFFSRNTRGRRAKFFFFIVESPAPPFPPARAAFFIERERGEREARVSAFSLARAGRKVLLSLPPWSGFPVSTRDLEGGRRTQSSSPSQAAARENKKRERSISLCDRLEKKAASEKRRRKGFAFFFHPRRSDLLFSVTGK